MGCLVTPLFTKAVRSAESAQTLFADDDYDGACDRAYYAMFNAARAMLVIESRLALVDTKSHASILRLFSEVFVRSGRAPQDFGRNFSTVQRLRAKADYAPVMATREDAAAAIESMTAMLRFAGEYIERRENTSND